MVSSRKEIRRKSKGHNIWQPFALACAAYDVDLLNALVCKTSRREVKRRTLKRFTSGISTDHHNVYVVLLDPAVRKIRKCRLANPKADPKKPCLYVGLSGLDPEQRFLNHKQGIKCSSIVKRFGL